MKKYLVILLALFLAVPAVSYAGSVTSRYDVTIGGYIKFDVAYTDQNTTYDYRTPSRESRGYGRESLADEYDAVTWAGGETRLNLSIKGPDGWGAKTSAFIEGDFRGGTGGGQGAATYGLFTLRHAFMTLDWGQTKLLVGHTWQAWGLLPTFNVLGFSENHFMKGATRIPQIRLTQKITKELDMVVGLASPENTFGKTQPSDKSRALYPDSSIELVYKSPVLGKIGPWGLTLGLGGMVGKEKATYQFPAGHYRSASLTRWGGSFYGFIPIIAEKANNKRGALALTGNFFMGQGLGLYLPAGPTNPYSTPAGFAFGATPEPSEGYPITNPSVEARYPVTSGGWAQLTYYITDKLFANLLWGCQSNAYSTPYRQANAEKAGSATNMKYLQNGIFNVMYDVNQAVRFGAEYTRISGSYPVGWSATGKPSGTLNAVRLGAYYYF